MKSSPNVTVKEYVAAFETWASVAKLPVDEDRLLKHALIQLQIQVQDETSRSVEHYCLLFKTYLQVTVDDKTTCENLERRIRKSCLLDRLLYLGEPLRTKPCPDHPGQWWGCSPYKCPHGCDTGCGCLTGWLPEPTTP